MIMNFLHIMLRVKDVGINTSFFAALGFLETRRFDNRAGRFTLVYLKSAVNPVEIELTHNWDQTQDYDSGNNFGHLAFAVSDINATCDELSRLGGVVVRPPRDGYMAFVKSPDQISIELLQQGGAIAPSGKYLDMKNVGNW
jgi:lactoylglutathione lyase